MQPQEANREPMVELDTGGNAVDVELKAEKEVQVEEQKDNNAEQAKEVVKEVQVEKVVEKIVTEKGEVIEVVKEVVVEKEVVKIEQVQVPVEKVVEVPVVIEVEKVFSSYGEAPQLTQLVQGGALPPVAERLPDQPMVIPTFGQTGNYVGTLRRFYIDPSDG